MDGTKRGERPVVVTLCGSTRFKKQFREAEAALTLEGKIVLSVVLFSQSDGIAVTKQQAELLGRLHLRKIDLSDETLVINAGGYIGESAAREIAYAKAAGKTVRYLEPEHAGGPAAI